MLREHVDLTMTVCNYHKQGNKNDRKRGIVYDDGKCPLIECCCIELQS